LKQIPRDIHEIQPLITLLLGIPGFTEQKAAVAILAMSASPSPSLVGDTVIDFVTDQLSPASIVELMVWLSLQQLLHRLSTYYSVRKQI
jgi:hypothetical protein